MPDRLVIQHENGKLRVACSTLPLFRSNKLQLMFAISYASCLKLSMLAATAATVEDGQAMYAYPCDMNVSHCIAQTESIDDYGSSTVSLFRSRAFADIGRLVTDLSFD